MARVKSDEAVYTVRPSDFDSIDPELRAALELLFSEKEKQAALEEEAAGRAYQAEQADIVLRQAGWIEVKVDSMDGVAGETSIHQFYEDLYGSDCLDITDRDQAILVNHRDRQHPYQAYEDYGTFIEGVRKETSFIYMGRFWEPTRKDGLRFPVSKKNAMTYINGVCVDIDRVEDDKGEHYSAKWVMETLFEFLDGNAGLMPNYLMLSGTGIQLWYVFGQSIPLLSKKAPRRAKYDKLIKRLYGYFAERLPKNRFKVDKPCAAYNHAFRAPGSPSKLGYPTRLFVYGGTDRKMIDPIELSHVIGYPLEPYDVGEWDQDYYDSLTGPADGRGKPASEKQLAYIRKLHDMGCVEDDVFAGAADMTVASADAAIKRAENLFTRVLHYRETGGGCVETSNGRRIRLKPRARGLYDNTLSRIREETKPGSRYMSMFVLAGLAYNCSVSRAALGHDLETLMNSDWGRKPSPTDGGPITSKDIKSAMLGYNPIGALRPRWMVEDVVGWSYDPPAKRNGRNRRDHLWSDWYVEGSDGSIKQVVNTARDNRRLASAKSRGCAAKSKRESSIKRLGAFLADHPAASKRAACTALGMSRTTVTKYWEAACAAAGVADTRTGNHRPF